MKNHPATILDDSDPRGHGNGGDLPFSVASFYQHDKPGKAINPPRNFVAPQFHEYARQPRFSTVAGIIEGRRQDAILSILERSGLRGRGGANFPVAGKWRAALEHPGPRYLIVNGQEGEPFTFKDYRLMTEFPDIVVEGVIIAALALNVKEVIFTINSAYTECIEKIDAAMADAWAALPALANLPFRVVSGPKPDLYVCGEETALIEFLEHHRGEPQPKPPFPFQAGYKGRPTVIQNVETLAWVPLAIADPSRFAAQPQLLLCHLFGAVEQPGIYQVSMGSPLQELLNRAGGLTPGSRLQAIEVGGLAGGLLPPGSIDLPLEQDAMTRKGAMVGTGSVRFIDQHHNLVDEALQAMEFFRAESCGRCTPCRVGTQELVRLAELMAAGSANDEDLDWFHDIAHTMRNTSTCGLGKGAPGLLSSLLRYWRVEQGQARLKVDRAGDSARQTVHELEMA
jgi:NADH:ubiquinone oxidoreductase subunit F (NADH-binding)